MVICKYKYIHTIALLHILLFCSIPAGLRAQNAPVTTTGIITNATTDPAGVVVPVTVKNFISIGAFTLTMSYPANQVAYVSAVPHPSFPGITVVNSVVGTLGKITITWPQTSGGITLPDDTHLLDLTFTYISGNANLRWSYYSPNVCQYKKYSSGSYIILNDTPKQSYYINGGIANRGAPVTYAPVISDPVPGNLALPFTVTNFTGIGAMSLTLEFNQAVLTYQSCVPNPGLSGTFNAGVQMGPNGKMLLTISWFGLASLADGSTVFTLNVVYSNANGSYSGLDWVETGSSCEYADQYAKAFFDSPTADYYINGAIYTQYAPKVWLPVITEAVMSNALSLPIFITNFNNVRSFTLSFEYEGTMMTYTGFTPDPAFGSELTVTDSPSGSKRKVVLSWTGTVDKTLPAGSLIAHVNFDYISGTTPLTWIITDGTSCRFNDSNGNAYFDAPKSAFYQDGFVSSHVAPLTVGGQQSAVSSQTVVVPVVVYDFTNIGLFTLTLDYDPSVLTYQSASLVPALGGTFSATTAGAGRIIMNWSGTAASLADSATLVNLDFIYNGGATTLAWFDDGNSCRYAATFSGPSLYDIPRSHYYINGYTGPGPLFADFTASSTSGNNDAEITLTDQSTGGPASWYWTISPSTYYFVNGTSASSQNPQIKFTANGGYTVKLYITRGTTSAVRIRNYYLHIGTPGLWTGITSSDWNVFSNWHNYAVPTSEVNVLIPSLTTNWPVIDGSLTIGGAQCSNVTLQGTAELFVNGNLSIINGAALTFTGSGLLTLEGNWTNTGTFNCSTSTVNFAGAGNATVNDNGSAQDFYKIIVSKTGGIVTFQGDVNVLGIE